MINHPTMYHSWRPLQKLSCLQPFHQRSISVASRKEKPANSIRSMAKQYEGMSSHIVASTSGLLPGVCWRQSRLSTSITTEQIIYMKWMLREISKFHSWPLKPMAPHHKIWTTYYSKVAKIFCSITTIWEQSYFSKAQMLASSRSKTELNSLHRL